MKNNILKNDIEDSVIHYQFETTNGIIEVFIESDEEGDTFYIVKNFNEKLFVITDFELFKRVLNSYQIQ